ncbi:MAG: spore cortex biosynthesis protein YabQ [Ruminococcus sp.]|nr:spore cortex biosynthesis protein YabQ [Ruminococcus sp.]
MSGEGFFPLREDVSRELEIFSFACILGIALGAVYDLLRGLRSGVRGGHTFENIFDFLYALFFFFCYFLLSVALTGELRFYTLASMLIGLACERYTLGRLVFRLAEVAFSLARKLYDRTIGVLVSKFLHTLAAQFVKSKSKLKKIIKKPKKVLKV